MKKLLFVLLILSLSSASFAEDVLFAYGSGTMAYHGQGLYTFTFPNGDCLSHCRLAPDVADADSGATLPKGYLMVYKDGRCGVICEKGIALPLQYVGIFNLDFNNTFYVVENDDSEQEKGLYKLTSSGAQAVLPCIYETVVGIPDAVLVGLEGKCGAFTLDGKQLVPIKYCSIAVKEQNNKKFQYYCLNKGQPQADVYLPNGKFLEKVPAKDLFYVTDEAYGYRLDSLSCPAKLQPLPSPDTKLHLVYEAIYGNP